MLIFLTDIAKDCFERDHYCDCGWLIVTSIKVYMIESLTSSSLPNEKYLSDS